MKETLKEILYFLWELIKIVVVAGIIVIPIRMFIFQPFIVKGASMEPNFHTGDYLIVDEISYKIREPKRDEVIVFRFPKNPSQFYIKRIIGLPGETVEIKKGEVIIHPAKGAPFKLDESFYLPREVKLTRQLKVKLKNNEYFVMGDNREFSSDSRIWGPLPRKYIIGRVLVRLWPPPLINKAFYPNL